MKRRAIVWAVAGAAATTLLAACVAGADMPLVTGGKPTATIHYLDGEGAAEIAADLQSYLEKMSGARLEVQAHKPEELTADAAPEGPSVLLMYGQEHLQRMGLAALGVSADQMRPEGFVLLCDGSERLSVLARDLAGLQFGVYDLLEQLGCRWYMPGDIGEEVPQREDVSVPESYALQNPDMIYRNMWYAYGSRPQWQRDAYAQWRMRNKMGGVQASMGHALYRYVRREDGDEHPEYFPLISGARRIPAQDAGSGWQPCTSDPEVIAVTVAKVRASFDENPDLWCASLSPNDGYGWCECRDCVPLDPPEYRTEARRGKGRRMLVFANQVAEELVKTHPDGYVCFYAYAGSVEPPGDLQAHPNVAVAVAHYGWCGDNYHALTDPRSVPNSKFLPLLDGWAAACGRLLAREYFTALPRETDALARIAAGYSLIEDIPYYRDHRVIGISSESIPDLGIAALNYYMAAKLMWDADADSAALLDDYYEGMYGPAAGTMRGLFEGIVAKVREYAGGGLFSAEDLDGYESALAQAHGEAATDKQKARVQLTADLLTYVRLLREMDEHPSQQAREALVAFADQHQTDMSFDYKLHEAGVMRPPELPALAPGGRGYYSGGPLKPASDAPTPAEAKALSAWCRGAHGWVVLAEEGQSFTLTIKQRRIGSRMNLANCVLLGPDGEVAGQAEVDVTEDGVISVERAQAGVYNLVISAGSNAVRVTCDADHFALLGPEISFLSATPRYWFTPAAGAASVRLQLETASPGETATLILYDPAGNEVARGDTMTRSSFAAQAQIPEAMRGRPWSLQITKAAEGVCEDNILTLGPEIVPLLATDPSRLMVPQ
ncbi:MAG TPA: DUF4838 domain-containing protein [Armatimonadota bacterium]|nr:DUF4838 domain-containing protein [Armatimonadota bacterium]